jgi:hypothetical protein
MATQDESELQIIAVKGSLPARPIQPAPATPRRPPPTRAQALEHLRSMKGAASVIERLPALGDITTWSETAFWDVTDAKGAALHSGPFLWDCDFHSSISLDFAYLNRVVTFRGTEPTLEIPGPIISPPPNQTGQIWCELDAPVSPSGHYLFVAEVESNGNSPASTVEFCIDNVYLGRKKLIAYYQLFLLELLAGVHRFSIVQVDGTIHYRTLSAWHIPILEQ